MNEEFQASKVSMVGSSPSSPPHPMISGLRRDGRFWAGVGIFAFILFFAFAGPLLDHQSPFRVHLAAIDAPPSPRYPLGTDGLGRDQLIRVMLGGQMILIVGLIAALGATGLGMVVGWASALSGRSGDMVGTWVMDVFLSVPQLVPILLIANLYRMNDVALILVIAFTSWPLVARIVRAGTLSLIERSYVEAAYSLGATKGSIMVRHILPNMAGTLLVAFTNTLGATIVMVATTSFLGFSLPPPAPNWATMVANSVSSMFGGYWWLMLFPGLALVLVEVSANLVADAAHTVWARRGGAA